MFFLFWLSLSDHKTVSRSIHVSANVTISFFFLWLRNIPNFPHSLPTQHSRAASMKVRPSCYLTTFFLFPSPAFTSMSLDARRLISRMSESFPLPIFLGSDTPQTFTTHSMSEWNHLSGCRMFVCILNTWERKAARRQEGRKVEKKENGKCVPWHVSLNTIFKRMRNGSKRNPGKEERTFKIEDRNHITVLDKS